MDEKPLTADEIDQLRPSDPHEEQVRPDPDPEHPSDSAWTGEPTANPDRTNAADIGDLLEQAQPVDLPEDDDTED